ncbi:unnamed protein product, partial [Onchocerca flexuosa]|uniref:RNA-directed DNA methylation 4 n=1 Tax=Onchocerca flexuosa TaxID=387005 RepID=A0A183HSU6_9BILA
DTDTSEIGEVVDRCELSKSTSFRSSSDRETCDEDEKKDAGEEPVDFIGVEDFTEEDLEVSYNEMS